MILDLVFTSKNLYLYNQVKIRPIYLLLGLNIIGYKSKTFIIWSILLLLKMIKLTSIQNKSFSFSMIKKVG